MENKQNIAEILCVGTELLLGDIVNTNAAFLSRELAALGFAVYHHSVVGDNPERLKDALALSLSRSELVVMSGGLGPTKDDLTKETVAEYFGLPLEMNEKCLSEIREYFAATGRRISFEYTLISGKNDSAADASELAELLNRNLRSRNETMPIHVNLIPVNPVTETEFSASDKQAVMKFASILEKNGIRATVRRRLGSDINASCGQLRRKSREEGLG